MAGACLGPRIQIGEETVITVDAKAAGKGKVTCTVSTPDGAELDVDVVENHDGTFDIYYTAPEPGKYVITIRFGGEHIPNSPFHVLVSATAEAGLHGVQGGRSGPLSNSKESQSPSPRLGSDAPQPSLCFPDPGGELGPLWHWSALSGGTRHVSS